MRKTHIWLGMFALVFVLFVSVSAVNAETVARGACGAPGYDVNWALDDAGTLTISGN